MHATRWGLETHPFAGHRDPVFFAGLPQQEALARLRFLVHNGRRLGLIAGQPGGGKSLLLQLFDEQARAENWAVTRLNLLGLSLREFHWQLAVGLRAAPRSGEEVSRLARRWHDRLQQNRLEATPTILLLDDADQAGADLVTQLVRLVQLPAAEVGQLTLVLATNAIETHRLGRRLLDLVDLRVELEPWDESDTIGYLQEALVAAGAQHPIFTEAALADVHRFSRGIPRQVNRLADFALVVGSANEVEVIDPATVAEAHATLTARQPSPAL